MQKRKFYKDVKPASDEFAGLAALGVTDVVSLLETAEAYDLGLSDEAQYCETARIRFHRASAMARGQSCDSGNVSP